MPQTKKSQKKNQHTLNDVLRKKRTIFKGTRKLGQRELRAYISSRQKKKEYGVVQSFLKSDFKSFLATHMPQNEPIVIDLGTFNRRFYKNSINVDIFQEGDTDLVWDITSKLPIKSGIADFVVCSAVLEHVNEPKKVIDEMHRILKPGGKVWVDIPFLQPFHESPDDFYRFTLSGIKHMFRDFKIHRSGAIPGSGFTVHWILKEFRGVLEWEKLLDKRKYPKMGKLLDKKNLQELEKELLKFDKDSETQFGQDLPFSFHITATGVYVYAEK